MKNKFKRLIVANKFSSLCKYLKAEIKLLVLFYKWIGNLKVQNILH